MKNEKYNIKTNIELGQQIFEALPNDIRPGWAGFILSRFDHYVKNIPSCVVDLYPIIAKPERWKEAHKQFQKIRNFSLDNNKYKPETYLLLAELVAKVTYNASYEPAPFDYDSGHYIPGLALTLTDYFKIETLEDDVKSAVLLFNRNKKLKDNLSVARDFFLYKKIDDILWFDWDPIGINNIAPRDEYQSYVPEIYGLVMSKASREEIANRLYKLETEKIGMSGTFENCLKIADKILKVQ